MEDAVTEAPETIGILGGSFDPPHVAHTLLAAYVLAAYPIDRVLVVPTYQHPFGKRLAPFEHRLAMCKCAFADLRRVEVSTIERDLGGESRTVRTLETLKTRLPHAKLRLVMGSDLLGETPRWHAFDRIEALAPPLPVGRGGHEYDRQLPITLPPVSSTALRQRLADGADVRGWLSLSVIEYIERHSLYRGR
jgi:nicotinate-nucleotide adenylyltransferase